MLLVLQNNVGRGGCVVRATEDMLDQTYSPKQVIQIAFLNSRVALCCGQCSLSVQQPDV